MDGRSRMLHSTPERVDAEIGQLVHHPLDAMRLPFCDHDPGAVLAEMVGHAAADALPCAGDDDNPAVDAAVAAVLPHCAQYDSSVRFPHISAIRYMLVNLCRRSRRKNARPRPALG